VNKARLSWLEILGLLIGILCLLIVVLGMVTYFLFPISLFPNIVFHYLVLVCIIGIVVLQIALAGPNLRKYWLEVDLIALVLFGLAVYTSSPFPVPAFAFPTFSSTPVSLSNPCIATPTPATPPNPTASVHGCFLLPADKIQTDLKNFQPYTSEGVSLLIVVPNNAVHSYNVVIADTRGIGSDTSDPPYTNDLVKVIVQLNDTEENRATDFANDLVSAKAIFILPHVVPTPTPTATPTPTVAPLSPIFVLPFDKLQLSKSCPTVPISEVILVTSNHNAYSYQATVNITPANICLSNQRSANNTSVTVTLTKVTAEVAATFAGQLSNAVAIYLV
jgi:hypothetical protein